MGEPPVGKSPNFAFIADLGLTYVPLFCIT